MAEQAGGGAGEQVLNPAVGRPGNPGLRSVRRPGARLATGTRAASGLRPGATSPCQELADGDRSATAVWLRFWPERQSGSRIRKSRAGSESAARRRKENAAAERREARRWAIPPAISGDPEIGPTARRATGAAYPHQRLSALCSLHFFERSRRRQRGTRPLSTGRRSVGFLPPASLPDIQKTRTQERTAWTHHRH
jgi:hypothetical protein